MVFKTSTNPLWALSPKKRKHFLIEVVMAQGKCLGISERRVSYSSRARRGKPLRNKVAPEGGKITRASPQKS